MSALVVRAMREDDLDEAARVFRVAFGTFLGLPDPTTFAGGSDWVQSRFRADPAGSGHHADRHKGTTLGTTGWHSRPCAPVDPPKARQYKALSLLRV